jgi:hypothetical protein
VPETRIHYLGWDRENMAVEEDPELGPASELFHKISVESVLDEDEKPPKAFTEQKFDDLYDEVTVLEGEYFEQDLEDIWQGFQHNDFPSMNEFLEARYCENCDNYIEGSDEALTHAVQNHDYDPEEEFGEPEYVHGIRSMSVGDVVQMDDVYHQARNIGFEEISVGGENP